MRDRSGGFSLIEVVLALGVLVFGVVAMLGVFPMGLDDSRRSISETRGAQLARAVFATLQTPPFTAVPCFGKVLDLSALDASDPPVKLYAKYPEPQAPEISAVKDNDSIYTLELRFDKKVAGPASGSANRITLTVFPQSKTAGSLDFATVVADY